MATSWSRVYGSLIGFLCCAPTALGQETPSLDKMPRHAYIKALDMQRFRVDAQVPPGLDPAPDERPYRIEHAVPLVMVNFDDVEPPYAIDTLQDHLFGTDDLRWRPATITRPTFRQYFSDMSYGKWQITGRCYGWYTLGAKDEFHQGNNLAEFWLGVYRMIWSALEHADRNVDFSRYDTENSGPLVDENPDGNVDTVFIVHPLIAAERSNESTRSRFRSHHWSLTELGNWLKNQGKTLPGEPPFVCNDVRRDAYGNRLRDDGEFVTIDDYCFVPAIHEPLTPDEEPVIPVGTYCHEYGHMLGLPDLYDRVAPKNAGLDKWCLMSEGLHGHDGNSPRFPVPLSAWCRYHLRWAEPHSWRSLLNQVLAPSGASPKVLKIPLSRRHLNWERYILVEYRNKSEREEEWKVNWDQSMQRPSGIALWLVDESVGREETPGEPNAKWPFASQGMGQCDDKDNPLVAFVQFLTSGGQQVDREGVKVALIQAAEDQATVEVESSAPLEANPLESVTTIPGIDAAAEPPIDAAPPEAREVEEIAERVLWTKEFGRSTLTNKDWQFLRNTSEHVLYQSLPASVAGIVTNEARKSRTVQIREDGPGAEANLPSKLRESAEQWKRWGRGDLPVIVRTAPDGKTIEWISGINKPVEGIDIKKEELRAQDLPSGDEFAQTFLQFTDDPDIELHPNDRQSFQAKDPQGDRVFSYHQVVPYADRQLPLLGYHSTVRVGSDGNLHSGKFDTVPTDELAITGSFKADEKGVTANVARVLGIDPRRVNFCQQGVGLVDKDPQKARLGYEVCISAGADRTPIKVFVDGETERILYVRSE